VNLEKKVCALTYWR